MSGLNLSQVTIHLDRRFAFGKAVVAAWTWWPTPQSLECMELYLSASYIFSQNGIYIQHNFASSISNELCTSSSNLSIKISLCMISHCVWVLVHTSQHCFSCTLCGEHTSSYVTERRVRQKNNNFPYPTSFCESSILPVLYSLKQFTSFHTEKLERLRKNPRSKQKHSELVTTIIRCSQKYKLHPHSMPTTTCSLQNIGDWIRVLFIYCTISSTLPSLLFCNVTHILSSHNSTKVPNLKQLCL
jgi:hypothetical protein